MGGRITWPTNPNLAANIELVTEQYRAGIRLQEIADGVDVPMTTLSGYFRRQIKIGQLEQRPRCPPRPGSANLRGPKPKPQYNHKPFEDWRKVPRCARCGIRVDFYDHPDLRMRVPPDAGGDLCGWCAQGPPKWGAFHL